MMTDHAREDALERLRWAAHNRVGCSLTAEQAQALAALTPQLSSTGLREKVARTLYDCERKRSDNCDEVIAAARGKPVKPSMAADWIDAAPHDRKAFLDDADAIIAMLPGGGWRPIETAPKDGTWVLGCWLLPGRAPLFGVVRWGVPENDEAGSEEGWIEGSVGVAGVTHWMPLPEAPAAMLSALPEEQGEGKGSPSRASLPVRPSADGGLGTPLEGE